MLTFVSTSAVKFCIFLLTFRKKYNKIYAENVEKENNMELTVKKFDELTTSELYEIIKARIQIFTVEQNCAYQDLDGKDFYCYHVFFSENGKILAYCRVAPKGLIYENVTIGRVITVARGTGLGKKLMLTALEVAKKKFSADIISIGAQIQAQGFYEKCGFVSTDKKYIEDGIPHVMMYKNI